MGERRIGYCNGEPIYTLDEGTIRGSTANYCHCGAAFEGSDHCPDCFCEQYERDCGVRPPVLCRFCGSPGVEREMGDSVRGVWFCKDCTNDFYVWPGLVQAFASELIWWADLDWIRSLRGELRDGGVIGTIGWVMYEWWLDHAHPGRMGELASKLLNNPKTVARKRSRGRKD